MCVSAAVMAVAALVTSAIGIAVSTYSSYQKQEATNTAAEYNAKVYEQNAQLAEEQASSIEQQGDIEAKQFRLYVSKFKGSQRSSFAGSGVVVDEGSAMDVLMDTTTYGELDALTIKRNAAKEAWSYRQQAKIYRSQGSLSLLNRGSSSLAATSTLLTGTSQLANSYANYKNSGVL